MVGVAVQLTNVTPVPTEYDDAGPPVYTLLIPEVNEPNEADRVHPVKDLPDFPLYDINSLPT